MCGLAIFCHAAPCEAEEFSDFADAKNAWDAGEYAVAKERFESLLAQSPTNEMILLETHKFLGVTYLFLGDEARAEEQFVQLLNRMPDFHLDPLVFPIDAVDFFTRIKRQNADRLAAVEAARLEAEKVRKAEEQAKLEAEIERLTKTVYVQKTEERNSLITAFMPFGAGQFQNGHKQKGIAFLTLESLLLASTVTTFAMHASLAKNAPAPLFSERAHSDYERREKGLRLANRISFISLAVIIVVGIADSMAHYTPYRIAWREVNENQVPRSLRSRTGRPRAMKLTPHVDGTAFGVGLGRSF